METDRKLADEIFLKAKQLTRINGARRKDNGDLMGAPVFFHFCRNSRPACIDGIAMSSVTASGFNKLAFSRPSSPEGCRAHLVIICLEPRFRNINNIVIAIFNKNSISALRFLRRLCINRGIFSSSTIGFYLSQDYAGNLHA